MDDEIEMMIFEISILMNTLKIELRNADVWQTRAKDTYDRITDMMLVVKEKQRERSYERST